MIENFEKFLDMLDKKLEQFFLSQQPYIFCKKGCAKCCQNAQFPFSEIEFKYARQGYEKLSKNAQNIIKNNIKKILEKKNNTNMDNFTYTCPFLINNECSIYKYRGIVCRTFGLLHIEAQNGSDVPFCALEGLNYSNVFDPATKKFSPAMFKTLDTEIEPVAFNLKYDFLTDEEFAKGYGFKFGKVKPLIDWIETSNYFN